MFEDAFPLDSVFEKFLAIVQHGPPNALFGCGVGHFDIHARYLIMLTLPDDIENYIHRVGRVRTWAKNELHRFIRDTDFKPSEPDLKNVTRKTT